MSRGKTGSRSSYIEYSPSRIKKMNKAKQRQEARWAAKSGPVITKRITEAEAP